MEWLTTEEVATQFKLNRKTLQEEARLHAVTIGGQQVFAMAGVAVAFRFGRVWRWSPDALRRAYAGVTLEQTDSTGLRLVG